MSVHEKFIGQMVLAKCGLGQTKGTVSETRRVWAGNWLLLITPANGSNPFWVKSRNCKITYC